MLRVVAGVVVRRAVVAVLVGLGRHLGLQLPQEPHTPLLSVLVVLVVVGLVHQRLVVCKVTPLRLAMRPLQLLLLEVVVVKPQIIVIQHQTVDQAAVVVGATQQMGQAGRETRPSLPLHKEMMEAMETEHIQPHRVVEVVEQQTQGLMVLVQPLEMAATELQVLFLV